jgi:hypothetical protein
MRVAENYGRQGGYEGAQRCDVRPAHGDFTEISTVVLNFMLLPFEVNYRTEIWSSRKYLSGPLSLAGGTAPNTEARIAVTAHPSYHHFLSQVFFLPWYFSP